MPQPISKVSQTQRTLAVCHSRAGSSTGAGLVAAGAAPRWHGMDEAAFVQAKGAPSQVFDTPEAIRDHEDLDRAQKIELLRRWAYDASELLVAEEEGMDRGERPDMARVLRVLADLGAGLEPERTPPTKQGGV